MLARYLDICVLCSAIQEAFSILDISLASNLEDSMHRGLWSEDTRCHASCCVVKDTLLKMMRSNPDDFLRSFELSRFL